VCCVVNNRGGVVIVDCVVFLKIGKINGCVVFVITLKADGG